ncbi:hypothetical protein B0J14DRAFT_30076 [Halenospora varia]|nr:hypothetical protein B0J14DRAFT_30076 [Halenospora varia]
MPLKQVLFSFVLFSLSSYPVIAQTQNVQFNQVINLNGDMQLNSLQFPDGSKIETFSQTQRQILVNQNPNPLTANHVVGSTGQPFVQLSQNSMTISTNNASDLVGAQIEMAIPQATLDQNGVSADNTFVAMLAPDRQSWMVMESQKSVNTTDSTVRMIKMNSIDGEFMAIGRKTVETSNVLSPFGQQQSVNITGSGIQEVEFTDGFRMSLKASMPMTVSTDVVNGVSSGMITNGVMPVNNYRYLVNSNLAGVIPNLNNMMAVVQLPVNAVRVMDMAMRMGAGGNGSVTLSVQQRAVLQNPGGANGVQPQKRQKASSTSKKSAGAVGSKTSSGVAMATGASEASATSEAASDATEAASAPATESAASAESASASPSTDASAAANSSTSTQPQSGNTGGASNTNPQSPAATQLLLAPTFTPINARAALDTTGGQSRIAVPVTQVDGEFILTMGMGTQRAAAEGQLGASASTGGLTISMAELQSLVEQQKNGGIMPTWSMMQQLMNEAQGQGARPAGEPAPAGAAAEPARPAVKPRSIRLNKARGVPFVV